MHTSELLLGIDVGTTAVKGGLYTTSGQCIFVESIRYPSSVPRPGWVEQEPADWMACIRRICAAAVDAARSRHIAAMGLTSQVNTHVFVDADGRVLLPAITWQDQRCTDAAAHLDRAIPAALRAECWGSEFRPDPSFLMSRAQWLVETEPELWQQTRWILSPKDYCLLQLTGNVAADATSSVFLVDRDGRYLSKAFELIPGLAERLPSLQPIEQVVGTVADEFLPGGCPAVVGIMDAWAALYGSGLSAHGDAYQLAGTSEVLGIISRDSYPAQGVVSFPPVAGWTLHAGPTQMGGATADWFAQLMEFEDVSEVFVRAQAAMARENPLVFLPHLMGERAPLWNPLARGAFVGMNRKHTMSDLARAALEGVGHASRLLLEQLEQAAGFAATAIRISGGGAHSDLWCQIKADIMDRPLHRLQNLDSGAFGAALMAGVGAGIYRDLATAGGAVVKVERIFVPDSTKRAYYEDLFALFKESYLALEGVHAGF